jgi:hypothetical protein
LRENINTWIGRVIRSIKLKRTHLQIFEIATAGAHGLAHVTRANVFDSHLGTRVSQSLVENTYSPSC